MKTLSWMTGALALFGVITLAACLSTDDSGGGGGGTLPIDTGDSQTTDQGDTPADTNPDMDFDMPNPDTSDPVPDSDIDTGPVNNLTCHLEIGEGECMDCITSSCASQLFAAFGSYGMPTVPGGACSEFLTCLNGCPCESESCGLECSEYIDSDCEAALAAGSACQEEMCASECEDEPDPCGNGYVDNGEQCDPEAELPNTCQGLGYEGGYLACSSYCTYDTSECYGELESICTQVDNPIFPGTQYDGVFSDASRGTGGPRGDGAFYQVLALVVAEPMTLNITMTSETFDCYLFLMDETCMQLAYDDDGGGGTNSMISYSFESPGAYYVVPTTYSPGATGAFQLIADTY